MIHSVLSDHDGLNKSQTEGTLTMNQHVEGLSVGQVVRLTQWLTAHLNTCISCPTG